MTSNLPPDVPPDVRYAVQLLTSETVTNAVRHSGCTEQDGIALRMQASQERVHIEVEDRGKGFDRPQSLLAEESRLRGFGLQMLNEIAQEWGVRPGPPTVVWFELPIKGS